MLLMRRGQMELAIWASCGWQGPAALPGTRHTSFFSWVAIICGNVGHLSRVSPGWPSPPPDPPTKQSHVTGTFLKVAQLSRHYGSPPHRTQQCSKKSCKNSIPPPDPVSKEYSTCISCRACDAVSKERNNQKQVNQMYTGLGLNWKLLLDSLGMGILI